MKKLFLDIYTQYRFLFYSTFFVATIAAGSDIITGILQKYILDNLIGEKNFIGFIGLLCLLFLGYTFNQVFGALTYYFGKKYGELIGKKYLELGLKKYSKLPFSNILDSKDGEINSIISNGSGALGQTVDKFFGHIVQNCCMILFGLGALFFIDIVIFLYFLCIFIPFFSLYSIHLIKKRTPLTKNLRNLEDSLSGNIFEYFGNIRDIKIFGVSNYFLQKFSIDLKDIFDLKIRIEKSHHIMNFIQFCILFGSMTIVLGYTGFKISKGLLSAGTFLLVFHIFSTIRFALWDMVFLYRNFSENFVKIEKFINFLSLQEDLESPREHIEFSELEIQNLSFSYDSTKNHLENINFSIKKGENIAIIGESGQGKTTLISIILGLFKASNGKILINGKSHLSIRNIFSYVAQDTKLFHHTLRFNLTLGEEYEDTLLEKILYQVGLGYLYSRSSTQNILDIVVGVDGLKLSAGERQRVGIARALIRKKDIYIFDEISSNLDEKTEKEVLNTLFTITREKTCIIITHKKEVLKSVDAIYAMDQGKLTLLTVM